MTAAEAAEPAAAETETPGAEVDADIVEVEVPHQKRHGTFNVLAFHTRLENKHFNGANTENDPNMKMIASTFCGFVLNKGTLVNVCFT